MVLDNASARVAKAFKGRRDQLAKIGGDLFYLPPRSPELNDIERIWRSAKYEDYPQRAHTRPRAKPLRPGCGEGAPELEPHVPHHSANAWRTASM
ncbi:transposase [Streptomyces mirabilis]